MRTLNAVLVSVVLILLSANALSLSSCANIDCDCAALPSDKWQASCQAREKQLSAMCNAKNTGQVEGYCSLHGPAAISVPLSIDIQTGNSVTEKQIVKLNHQLAALYWSLHVDLEKFQENISAKKLTKAKQTLVLIDNNVDNLFRIQKNITQSQLEYKKAAEAEKSWRHFAEDSNRVGELLLDYSKALLLIANSMDSESKKRNTHQLALKGLEISGRVFEQSGFAYGKGVRHKSASEIWKTAANIAVMLIDNNLTPSGRGETDKYQYQAAMRLHKASYYWIIAENAQTDEQLISKNEEILQNTTKLKELVESEMNGEATAKYK